MSHFEFILTGNLTPDVEERSKQLLNDNNKYYIPYVIHKYIDEDIGEDKKNRTIIVHSHLNISDFLLKKFVNCGLELRVYWKQQIAI